MVKEEKRHFLKIQNSLNGLCFWRKQFGIFCNINRKVNYSLLDYWITTLQYLTCTLPLIDVYYVDVPAFEVGSTPLENVRGQRNLFCSVISFNETLFPRFSHVQILVVSNRNSSSGDPAVSDTSAAAEIYARNSSHFEACIYVVGGLKMGESNPHLNWFAFQPKNVHLRSDHQFIGGTTPLPIYSSGDQCVDMGSSFQVKFLSKTMKRSLVVTGQ